MKAQNAEERRKKLQWQTAMYEASLQNGYLRICWDPLVCVVSPAVFDFGSNFGMPLRALRLIGVGLTELPAELGDRLVSLEVLSLSNNHIVSLPDNIAQLTNLRELNLMYNRLVSLPPRIGYMCSLQKIGVANNQLEALPVTFGALNLIERLDLQHNLLTVLPENLDNMISCKMLNVNNNRLTRLPRCIGRMPSLTSLSACSNALSYVPSQICSSSTLVTLRLNVNQIARLPDRFGDLVQLHELNLDYNRLVALPVNFWKLQSLKLLRIEGNDGMKDPPAEIIGAGGAAIILYCRNLHLQDTQSRMRHIILTTQHVLQQMHERGLPDSSLFEVDVKRSPADLDRWFALQLPYFWNDLLPHLKELWHAERMGHPDALTTDAVSTFDYNEQEVMHAFANFADAAGPVIRAQKAMFKRCSCVDETGKRNPCIPPKIGFMCYRQCVLVKQQLVRQKDKVDRQWSAYKTNGLMDAVNRAEHEAKLYLDSYAGDLWLEETAYEQAEEVLQEGGVDAVVQGKYAGLERQKKKIIAKFDYKIDRVQKERDRKLGQLEASLEQLKADKQKAREGYVQNALDQRISALTVQLANLPETIQLKQLQTDCERDCLLLDEGLYDSDSVNTSEEDSSEFSSEDESPEAERWRVRLSRRDAKALQKENHTKIKGRFDIKMDQKKGLLAQAHHMVEEVVVNPVLLPLGHAVSYQYKSTRRKIARSYRTIVEGATIRARKLYMTANGHFNEIQKELKYEIYRQYVDHHMQIAKDKARREFRVIETVRQSMEGMGRDKAFRAWKFFMITKKRRMRKDLRKVWKMATRGFEAAMHSVTSAQFQVDLWIKNKDIYRDEIYWKNEVNGNITYDRPGVQHYLPSNFQIPIPPDDLPEDIPLETSSSEDSQGEGWILQHEEKRRKMREQATLLKLATEGGASSSDSDESSMNMADIVGGGEQPLHSQRRKTVHTAEQLSLQTAAPNTITTNTEHAETAAQAGSEQKVLTARSQGSNGGSSASGSSSSGSGISGGTSGGTSTGSGAVESSESRPSPSPSLSVASKGTKDTKGTGQQGSGNVQEAQALLADSHDMQLVDSASALALAEEGQEGQGGQMVAYSEQSAEQYWDEAAQAWQYVDPSQSWDPTSQSTWDLRSQRWTHGQGEEQQVWDPSSQSWRHSAALSWDASSQQGWDQSNSTYSANSWDHTQAGAGDSQQQLEGPQPQLAGSSSSLAHNPQALASVSETATAGQYGFRKLLDRYTYSFDEQEENYIGVQNSVASSRLQDAVEEARFYMENNALYLARKEMASKPVPVASSKPQRRSKRVSKDPEVLAAAHKAIDLFAKPSDFEEEAKIIRENARQEYEVAFKAIRKRRNEVNPERHKTYIHQMNRNPCALEDYQTARVEATPVEGSTEAFEVRLEKFLDKAEKTGFEPPTELELLQLAGGDTVMVTTGKEGMELRTVLAQRALHVKKRLEDRAVERELIPPKKNNTFWGRNFKPLFTDKYRGSSEEEEDEEELVAKGKLARRRQRKDKRATKALMAQHLKVSKD
ncbi:hypothetical protein B484DRAFT_415932 [Ochromonadaceae sp. CCMP2298]|nr:hypothetical protein B484DRAFT_415932 [Ochromonadaceae sp. CCMP2298]